MQVFNGRVRLGGSLQHEVYKRGLTTPEILVLRKLHGHDGVVGLEHAGNADVDDDDERERLQYLYGDGLAALSEDQKTSIEKMFSTYGALPQQLKDYTGEFSDKEDELEEFQKSLPFASPNAEDEGKQKKKAKAEQKAAAKALKATNQKSGAGKKTLETLT